VINAEHCLVFEDADLEIQGAKAAGMGYVRVTREGFDLKASAF
jgi:beta-phosphoglucomutase-like phosphatase (HAD superfamily)